ncbi:lysozyme [Sphingomonas cannabina]|uniref:lysozyme n=1 Tax=Sphingomonas cannabina TaxID=2899123 RepID=UPI001F3A822D|nr:lysozyme [Sphingomonas cannabina]UIJ46891.1 lysozyme [Sphingomonas cannabina]
MPVTLPKPGKKTLAAIVGAVTALGLLVSIPKDESGRTVDAAIKPTGEIVVTHKAGDQHLDAYRDIAGIWTICDGDTANVKPGLRETQAGCQARLERQLIAHAEPVMACTPRLRERGRDYQRWAAISLAYNIGTAAYCGSTVDRRFDAGDWRGGCDAFLMWVKASGKIVRGLQLRRQREREICLRGLT